MPSSFQSKGADDFCRRMEGMGARASSSGHACIRASGERGRRKAILLATLVWCFFFFSCFIPPLLSFPLLILLFWGIRIPDG